ncbi:MAG TPA: amidohydrolase family protein [Stellaceae bacterium]|jgi:predicted TIM-barrel fold metal-dependent hydrolase|nr:amidohydrolase family protein [Stellaceae bacterium]
MIIDAQIHIWDAIPQHLRHEHPDEMVEFSYEELLRRMDAAGVGAAMLVPRSFEGDRNDYAIEAARKHPDRFAVMGRVAMDEATGKPQLRRLKDEGMLGIRLTFHRNADRPFLTDGSTDWLWPEAEALDIPIMVHAPERLTRLGELAAAHPKLRLILDHMGFARPDIDDEMAPAVERLLPLAKHPNFFVKVSAAPCYTTQAFPYRNVQAQIRRIVDAFGASRCFWGSDLTRLPANVSFEQCVRMFTEGDFLTSAELPEVMGNALSRCLRWPG